MKKPFYSCIMCKWCNVHDGFCDEKLVNMQITVQETALPDYIKPHIHSRFRPTEGFGCNQYKKRRKLSPVPPIVPRK